MGKQESMYRLVYKSALTLFHQLQAEETYATIAKEAKKLVKAKYVSIFLQENGELRRIHSSSPLLNTITVKKHGYTFKTYSTRKPFLLQIDEILDLHPKFKKLGIQSDITVPLTYKNQTFGVLSVLSSKRKRFTKKDVDTLVLFSPLASLALRNMQLYSEIRTALKERDLFVSLAAHELRTPLTTMSLYSELLMQKKRGSRVFEVQLKEKLRGEIGRVSRLVTELMQINQIRKGELKVDLVTCNLVSIIEETLFTFRKIFPNNSYIFINNLKDQPCLISADPDKLSQVIINLLHNATKFSSLDRPIEIMITSTPTCYQTMIKDHGKGISNEDLTKIFNRFYQGIHKQEGLGLGLYLTKQIVDRHCGKITVSSVPHQETIFSVSLPRLDR